MMLQSIHLIDILWNMHQGGYSLGKGEVESSIPSGSTTKHPMKYAVFAGLGTVCVTYDRSCLLLNDSGTIGDCVGTAWG
jgi:hypothetical protein